MNDDSSVGYYFDHISKLPSYSREEEAALHGQIKKSRERIARTIGSKNSLERLRQITFSEDNDDKIDNEETLLILNCIDDPNEKNVERLRAYFLTADFDILRQYCERLKTTRKELALIREARDLLVQSNLKWAVALAKHYTKNNMSMSFLDIIQEGNIGLMRAVDKFDPSRGRLSTVATHWIRQSIIRALSNKERQIRVPVHLIDSFNRAFRSLSAEGLPLTPENVFPRVDIPNMTLFRTYEIMTIMNGPVDLDRPTTDSDYDGDDTQEHDQIEASIPDDRIDADESIRQAELDSTIARIIRRLPPREEKVLRLTLGI